ncbi:MAG TPA: T9SS type A sorting domain-containing protein [Chryseosolibacter sp.]
MVRVWCFLVAFISLTFAYPQVKPEYLYNTSLPFGTLDLRTKISATNYYYLQENITFSFRESSPGVRTNTFADVTSWDSSPYGEGHMRRKNGAADEFVMNYRLLKPANYDPDYADGYPLILIMHGAVERGNCYYKNCYHADWNYNPNTNVPPAPTNPDHRLLNNDYHLTQSAKEHLVARNLAGTRLPNDPSMPARAFPGFVLMPQILNVWDSLTVEDAIRVVLLHAEKYNINPDRIYIHGLSIGGYATYEAIKRAPWLFACALPMSAVSEAGNIFKHNQQDKVAHIPLWTFQGGKDIDPTPELTQQTVNKFKAAGASIQYTVYADLEHRVWGRAYGEANFFSWILSKRKNNIHALHGVTQIDHSKGTFPKLVLPEGFFAYQWQKDGAVVAGQTTHRLTVTSPGTYRARFSRKPSPAETDWNAWSQPIAITSIGTTPPLEEPPVEEPPVEEPPVEEPPTEEPPAEEPPVQEPPVEEPPVAQPPGEEPPPSSPPAEEPPAEEPGGSEEPGTPGGVEDPDLTGNDDDEIDDGETVTNIGNDPVTSISVYPNPTNSANVNIALHGLASAYIIRIVDTMGSIKFENSLAAGHTYQLDDLNLRKGIYLVTISDGKTTVTKRLVIGEK